MTISIIASIIPIKGQLAIGKLNNGKKELIVSMKRDMEFFKDITAHSKCSNSRLKLNIVLMGRGTFDSIKNMPLENRINFVLTNNYDIINTWSTKNVNSDENKIYYNKHPNDLFDFSLSFGDFDDKVVYFMDMFTFVNIYNKFSPNVFVIGGAEIYKMFLYSEETTKNMHYASKLYISEIYGYQAEKGSSYINLPNFSFHYHLVDYSEKQNEGKYSFRVLYYDVGKRSEEGKYLDLAKYILDHGTMKDNRTKEQTLSITGAHMRFNITNCIPLLTVKNVPFNIILQELLLFLRGDTDVKILQKKGIHIWDGNTSREYLDSRNLQHYSEGILGPGYSWQYRFFNKPYDEKYSNTSLLDDKDFSYLRENSFDQLKYVENLLKTDPFSRRIIISAWNPLQNDEMCLPCCHFQVQFIVTKSCFDELLLSAMFTMRSSDELARSFNVVYYSIFVYILAKKCNMKPHEVIYNAGDAHIYKNHIEQISRYIKRIPRPSPMLYISDKVVDLDYSELTEEHFELIGYYPHPAIKMDMVV